jgi:hypothetical protein
MNCQKSTLWISSILETKIRELNKQRQEIFRYWENDGIYWDSLCNYNCPIYKTDYEGPRSVVRWNKDNLKDVVSRDVMKW